VDLNTSFAITLEVKVGKTIHFCFLFFPFIFSYLLPILSKIDEFQKSSGVYWHRFDYDPDPNFHVDADPDQDWHQNDADPHTDPTKCSTIFFYF
jgi:hypothetical protein